MTSKKRICSITSKTIKISGDIPMPKTPHEEVMFVVESTNAIVSKHTHDINRIREILGDILKILEEKE